MAHTIPSKGNHLNSMGTKIFLRKGLVYNISKPQVIQNDDRQLVTKEIIDENNGKLTVTYI